MNSEQIHVLIIEDDVAYGRLLEKTLLHDVHNHYTFRLARTLATSLQALSQQQFDVIVLDILLPDCSDTTKELKSFQELAPQSAIVILTAVGSEALGHYAIQHGAQDYLFKHNFNPDTFTRSMHYAIERQRHALYSTPPEPSYEELPADELEAIIHSSGEGILVFDEHKAVVMANHTAEEILGRPLVGLTVAELDLPADLNNQPINLEIKRENRPPITAEWYVLDFTWRNQAATLVTLQNIADYHDRAQKSDPQISQIQILSDISGALRASNTPEATFRFALERIARAVKTKSSIFLVDKETDELVIVGWYPPTDRVIGLRKPTHTGLSGMVMRSARPYFTNNLKEDKQAIINPALAEIIAEVQALLVLPILAQNQPIGTLHIGLTESRPFTLDEIRLFTAIAEMLSISLERLNLMETLERRVYERTKELQEANDKLRQLDQLKTKFIADMSHELRTPITAMRLYIDLLKRGRIERQAHYMNTLEKQLVRLTDLAEKILSLSRLDVTDRPLQMQPLDLNHLIEPLYLLYQQRAEDQKLTFLFDAGKNLPAVHGIANHLSEAINHLLDNAFNYTQNGFIRLHTTVANDEVVLSVEDSGLGIAAHEQTLVFDRFYRGDLVAQLNIPGTGLGLTIVQEIVNIHHGRLELQSQADVGSKFTVYLPVAEKSTAEEVSSEQ